MGKKKAAANPTTTSEQKEGFNLLGSPTFQTLENGRLKCVETGHELPAHSRDSYALSKHCRLGLIDSAVSRKKPPVNMFRQDPAARSKLICKLTGVTINKSEEHIWKHISGKRFLSMLEKEEVEKEMQHGTKGKLDEEKQEKKKKKNEDGKLKKKKKTKESEEIADEKISEIRDSIGKESDSVEDVDFWIPPVGNRCDNDDGGDRWGSGLESEDGAGDEDAVSEKANYEAGELSKRTKRMSLEIGPSSFASRKKKKKLAQS
ncbi:uncharacterized protein [Primulina eburnea]|uniref:uncharacterized protein n=1 Tax=Primulina eburnea TaxID=1245227 RepID=UPI003C6CA2B1